MSGRLVGIGVGPGDPELLTLKAVRRLGEADVIVAVAAGDRPSRAAGITEAHVPPLTRQRTVALTMGPDPDATARSYRRLADIVGAELAAGATVAVLCEGDPLLFGTFVHLLRHLAEPTTVEVVPGIPSPIAAAAADLRPLAVTTEGFGVLPATMGAARLHACLATLASAAVIKVGRHLPEVRDLLQQLGLLADARLVVELGGTAERRLALADWPEPRAPYFSLVLTRGLAPADVA